MSYTFQKWDSVTHPIIEAVDDYNSIVDALNDLLTTLDNINPPSSIIPVPTFSLNVDYEGLGTYDFRCWIKVTIPHTNNASNFVVAYKKSTETIFNTFIVKQEETGDTVALTPILKENTLYDVKVRCIGGTGGIGDFSAIQQITTPANTIAYPVPENVSAYGILNGVIISWDSLDRTYYRYASYNVYHNTVDDFDTATLVGNISGSDYLWNMNEEDEYVPQYFWVTSVSPSGIESNPSTVVYATPIKLTPLNMEISMMPWTADFKIWEDTTTYGTFYWADNTELLDGTIYYADETTATITKNLTGTALTVGLHYAYIEDGNSNLTITEIYGDAVGVGKNLLAIIHVTAVGVDGKPSTIQPYNSYTPTIGAGGIAAKTIRAEHLITDNIILYDTQIADGIISSKHVLQIDAQKILLSSDEGTFFLNEWQDPNDMTKIHGSVIKTGTITNEKILNIEAEKVKINSVGEGVYFNELLDTSAGTTTIKGGAITAKSITLDRLEEDAIKTDPYGTTYIDGGKIYTGSITADQITSNWITGKNIRTASSGQRIILGTYTLDGITATGIGCVGESLLFFDIAETFCGGIAGDSGDLLIGNPNGKIIIEAAEGSGVVEIAGTISLQNSIDSMFEFRSPLTEISGTDLTDYIWEWKNGIWTPSGKTIPTGNSFLRIKDETTNYATDLFGVIVNHDGYINPLFGVSTGFVVKKDISCGGYIAANQGIFAAGSGLQTQFDPAGVWLIHSGLSSIHDIDQLSSAPANPVKGQYYINTINNHIFEYNGTTWIDKGDADNCTYNFDTFVIRKAGYTKPKPPFATANLPIPSNELGHVMANTLYADNLKKVDGTDWSFGDTFDQYLNTTNDVRFQSVSCDLALKVGSWGSQEFSVTVDSSKVYLTSHAARDFYIGTLSGYKTIFQRNTRVLGNAEFGSSTYPKIQLGDNGIQLGAGTGATFDIALTRETSPSPHLLISKDTQIDGALGVAGINVTGTGGFTSATSSISYIECKVTDDDYPRLRLRDDYIAFGSGSANPTVSLSYETSPSTRLQVNGHFQVTGNANFLNVSATNEIGCALLTLGKIRIGSSYGNEGEVLTSQGYDKAPIWTTPSSWDGGTVTKATTFNNTVDLQNILRIVRANPSSSYIENKVTGDTYPRIKLIDDYIAFGSGSANPTLTLGYSTTDGAHLHLNGAFQVDGATGLAALNVSGLVGLNNLVTVKKASAGAGHIDFKVGTETYPRLRIVDNYFAFGTGAASPNLTLSYQTSPKVRLEISGNFQVVGDTNLNALSVSGIAGFSDTVDIQKFAINENVGSAGQVIKSTGEGTIEWGDASTWNGGTVSNGINLTGIGPELGLRIASYIELGQFINGFNPYIAFNAKQETFSGGINRLTPRYGEEDFCSMGMFRGETASGTLSYEVYKSGESTTPVSIGNFTKVLTMYDTGKVLFPNTDATYGGIWINDIRLYSWDDNVLGISSFVNIVPSADDAKLDLRAPSNKDAILNLMCDGDVKAVLAYDSSETKTYLAAYASSGTHSQLHLNGSKIVLENDTRITGAVLEINNATPILNLNLANGANRATFGFDGTTTYISTQSGNLQISPYGNVVITKNIEATTGTTAVKPQLVGSGTEAVYGGPGVLSYISSSKRYKENIKPITNADWIYELSPVIFNRIGNDVEHKEIGLIAEDVYEIYPQIVNKDSDGRIDNIRYTGLITPLLIEIQNLKKENNVLKTKLAKMDDLEKRIVALENSKIAG